MNEVISKALCKYENLIVMGDFNTFINSSNSEKVSWSISAIFII